MASSKSRLINIEVCRIFTMLIIVFNHFAGYCVELIPNQFEKYEWNRVFLRFMNFGGKIGVNVFILITGYFAINSKCNIKKLLLLWTQVCFYSVGIYLVAVLLHVDTFSFKTLISTALPVTSNRYWFFTTYFELYLLTPIINFLLHRIDKRQYSGMLTVLFIMLSVWPTITTRDIFHSELLWFIFVYILGGYLSRYPDVEWERYSQRTYLFIMIGNILLVQILTVMLDYSPKLYSIFGDVLYFRNMYVVTGLTCALFVFLFFRHVELTLSRSVQKFIYFCSTQAFAVYLIHMNPSIYKWIWTDLFHLSSHLERWYFPPISIFCCIVVYLISILIEKVRSISIGRMNELLIDFAYNKYDLLKKIENLINLQ